MSLGKKARLAGFALASNLSMAGPEKRFVYVLRSERESRPYVGVTSDVRQRVETHNSGGSLYTAPHRPWRLVRLPRIRLRGVSSCLRTLLEVRLRPRLREAAFQVIVRTACGHASHKPETVVHDATLLPRHDTLPLQREARLLDAPDNINRRHLDRSRRRPALAPVEIVIVTAMLYI